MCKDGYRLANGVLFAKFSRALSSKVGYRLFYIGQFVQSLFGKRTTCANALFANKNINIWVRLLSHAAIVFGGFALYLVIVKQYAVNSIVALTPAFAVVYALIMTVVLILRNIKNKNERDDSEYTAVYANITEAQKNKKTNIKK